MKLITSAASPFVRKARVALYESGHEAEVEEISVTTSPYATAPEILTANPLGKIPALIREGEHAIYDSRVITRYFDSLWNVGLYPDANLWEVLTVEATCDAIMEAAVLITYEKRFRPDGMVFEDWVEAQWAKVDRAISALEADWMHVLEGPTTMASLAACIALEYVDLRCGDRNWRQGRAALSDWQAKMTDRPSLARTRPE